MPDDLKELVEKIEESEEQEEQPMEGVEEEETSADVIDDANQNPIGSKSSCDPPEFMDTTNTVVESNLGPSEPNNVEEEASVQKPQLTEEESNEQTLERSWNKFMKKYGSKCFKTVLITIVSVFRIRLYLCRLSNSKNVRPQQRKKTKRPRPKRRQNNNL